MFNSVYFMKVLLIIIHKKISGLACMQIDKFDFQSSQKFIHTFYWT